MEETNVSRWAGLYPDFPLTNEPSDIGRRVMALVRSAEKADGDSRTELLHKLSEILRHLIVLYSRRGLLQGDREKARKLLETANPTPLAAGSSRRGNKRNSRGEDLRIHTERETAGQSSGIEDETLLLSALLRILGGTQKSEEDYSLIVALAADVCTAVSDHIKENGTHGTCEAAELEILLGSGRSLLTGLGASMKGLVSKRTSASQSDNTKETLALTSCLCATTSLVSLFGTKMARSGSTITAIRNVGWSVLTDRDVQVQQSGALMLSSIPLTGVDNKPPPEMLSSSIMDAVTALSFVLDSMAPLRKRKSNQSSVSSMLSDETKTIVTNWIDHIRENAENEAVRGEEFQSYIQGLSAYLVALITREAYDTTTLSLMVSAKIPVEHILELADTMLGFPSSAESLFFSTKKRLRLEIINNGLLSSTAVVLKMANLVKSLGHEILDATISAAGGPSLLPFARHITRIAFTSLLASSSSALQRVIEPTSATRLDGKRKKWLHTSVILRSKAIQTYSTAIRTLGPSVLAGSLSDGSSRGASYYHEESRATSLIGGSLLEQLSWATSSIEETDEDWATLSQRVELTTTALNALSCVLTTGGGYLPLPSRSLIESITLFCISSTRLLTTSKFAAWPSVNLAILKLGNACLCTPWPDGAMSSIMEDLKVFACTCARDHNIDVVTGANDCLLLCDSLAMPRVPALSVVNRADGLDGSRGAALQQTLSATSLIEGLKSAREEISVAEKNASLPIPSASKAPVEKGGIKKKQPKVRTIDDADATMSPTQKSKTKHDAQPESTTASETQREETTMMNTAQESSKGFIAHHSSEDNVVADGKASPDKMDSYEDGPDTGKLHHVEQKKTPEPTSIPLYHQPKDANGDDSDDDDFLPDIVDCGPDEEDR